jgi:arsenite-transporting ATPase
VRLLVVAGKGGVGKTTVPPRSRSGWREWPQRVLLLSADPAHSLGDVLDAASVTTSGPSRRPGGLRVRELDTDWSCGRARERYQRTVEETFDSLLRGSRFDVAYDREALRGLMDLAPPGMDELFAILSVIEALLERAPPIDLVVLDTAPTGHALRLLEMPAAALGWVHALLAILLKYREVVGLGDVAADLVATARRLRELIALLTDPARARVIAVTRAAELPHRETERLLERLRRLHMTVPAVMVNAMTPPGAGAASARAARAAVARPAGRRSAATTAGVEYHRLTGGHASPRGVAALRAWSRVGRSRMKTSRESATYLIAWSRAIVAPRWPALPAACPARARSGCSRRPATSGWWPPTRRWASTAERRSSGDSRIWSGSPCGARPMPGWWSTSRGGGPRCR